MFENLQNPNQPNRSQVDDIFADTDQAIDAQPPMRSAVATPQSTTLTPPTGSLSDPDLGQPEKKSGKGFMIAVVMMSVIILGLLGYLVYNKFFKADNLEVTPNTNEEANQNIVATTTPEDTTEENGAATSTNEEVTNNNEFIDFLPVTPGGDSTSSVTVESESGVDEEAVSPSLPVTPVDSDSDGLTDDEEAVLGTNPNIIDSDNDGLSDYEEVKIYQTNPLAVDTDGDGFPDGTEVRGGYNPNGDGKLPGNIQ